MTTDAWLAFALGVAIPSILAILGGVLAVRSLATATKPERWLWIWSFTALGALGLVFRVVQQIRITAQQHEVEVAAALKAKEDSNQVNYFKGMLDVQTRLLGVFAQNTDPKREAELLKAMAGSRSPAIQPTLAAQPPTGPNNAQLADSAKELARGFRELQKDLNWRDANERETHANGAN